MSESEYGNEDVAQIEVWIPEGHMHARTRIHLSDGTGLVFQEATIHGLLRAFVTVTSHPLKRSVKLVGRTGEGFKKGYAPWQLLEE